MARPKVEFSWRPIFVESNFDKVILNLFSEVDTWKRFQGEHPIPYIAHDMIGQEEKLRILRENVMLVVRDYNEIMLQLDAEEKDLFQEHIKRLDKRLTLAFRDFRGPQKASLNGTSRIEKIVLAHATLS